MISNDLWPSSPTIGIVYKAIRDALHPFRTTVLLSYDDWSDIEYDRRKVEIECKAFPPTDRLVVAMSRSDLIDGLEVVYLDLARAAYSHFSQLRYEPEVNIILGDN